MINAFLTPYLFIIKKHYLFLFTLLILLGSCRTVRQPIYFESIGARDTSIKKYLNKEADLKIRKGDIVSINISSITPDVVVYNSANSPGYVVDNEGDIYILNIGKIHAEGLTRKELKVLVEKQLSAYLKDPLVSIKFLNHSVTVLGEVSHPQTFPLNQDNVNLLEIISMAGEVTALGRKDNVLIVRDSDSGKQFHRVNLLNTSVFNSPDYYIKPDDIVYVEPKKVKVIIGQQATQLVSLGLSLISVLLILIRGLK